VRRKDELEQQILLDGDEFGISLLYDIGHLGGFEGLLDLGHGILLAVLAEFDDLSEDSCPDFWERDLGNFLIIVVLSESILDKLRHPGNIYINREVFSIHADQLHGS
jgi:hypothetical protein